MLLLYVIFSMSDRCHREPEIRRLLYLVRRLGGEGFGSANLFPSSTNGVARPGNLYHPCRRLNQARHALPPDSPWRVPLHSSAPKVPSILRRADALWPRLPRARNHGNVSTPNRSATDK